jgi:hypothetical protein
MAGYLPFHDQNIISMSKKIYKGEFWCPRWFSPLLTWLLTRLLNMNSETQITIPEIMENRWFKKRFKHIKFYIEDDKLCNVVEEEEGEGTEDDDSILDQFESESKSGFEMT